MHIFRVAWFTFFQAACSTLMALIIGFPAAFFCSRHRFPGRKILLSLSVVPFCVPSIITALGYVTFLGFNGGLNRFLMFVFGFEEPPVKFLYSFAGLIIAHGFYNFPLIMKTVANAWETLPKQNAEAARLLGASEKRIFRTVTVYQLMPSVASSCMLVFIYCFLSFVMVLLFGGIGNSTLEVEIYKAARATLDFNYAFRLGILEIIILVAVTGFYCVLEQKAARAKGLSGAYPNPAEKFSGITDRLGFAAVILLILVFFIGPFLGIIVNAFTSSKAGTGFTLDTFKKLAGMCSFLPSVVSTIRTAAATAVLCTFLGLVYSVILKFFEDRISKTGTIIMKIIPVVPMCISSVIVGVIITLLVRRGNVLHLILAQTALTWPLAFRQIYPQLTKIPLETMDCARLLSKNPLDIVLRVLIPVSKRGLLSAFGFCFAVSAGDTTLPLVLAIPKYDALSLFIYRLAGSYRFNEACAAGLILGLICVLMFALTQEKNRRA